MATATHNNGIHRNRLESPENKRVSLFLTEAQISQLKKYAKKNKVSYSALIRSFNQKFLELSAAEWSIISDELQQGVFGTEHSKYKLALVPVESCNEQTIPA